MIHPTHTPAPPMTLGDSTGLVYCKACGALLTSDRRGEGTGRRVAQPCVPVRVALR